MRTLINFALVALAVCLIASCNNETPKHLEFAELSPSEVDSIDIVNSNKEVENIPGLSDSTKGLMKGSIGDEWKKYFKQCLKSDIDAKASYVSMANTDGPGMLIDTKLGLGRKHLKNILPPAVYNTLIDTAGNVPVCELDGNDYRLIGGFFKATLFNLLKINPEAQGTKLDTIAFHINGYRRVSLKGDVLDSLYNTRKNDPSLNAFFEDFSNKKVSLIIKGYIISGFSANIKFSRLDTAGLIVGLDSGLVKNVSASLGFKFKKSKNNHITASSTGDFIPLVQYVRLKEIR